MQNLKGRFHVGLLVQALPTKFLRHIGRGAVVADIGGVSMMLYAAPINRGSLDAVNMLESISTAERDWRESLRLQEDGGSPVGLQLDGICDCSLCPVHARLQEGHCR